MKRTLGILFLACIVVLSMFTPAAAASPPFTGTVLQRSNLRAGPGTNYAIVGKANAGTVVEVASCNSGCTWYKLDTGQWIAAFLVKAGTDGGGGGGGEDPGGCDPSYPTVCIPPKWKVGDLDCADVPQYAYFKVYQPDPHFFDGDYDGWGCEWN
jgi:Bacterial SH3 domain